MKKIIIIVLPILIFLGGILGYQYYKKNHSNAVTKEGYLYIPKNANFTQIVDSLRPFVADTKTFEEVATKNNMDKYFHHGRYKIKNGQSNLDLVEMIKMGNQADLSFRIGDFQNIYQMIGKVTKKTEIDSLAFISKLNEIAIKKGLSDAEALKNYFFTDTYSFFWTVTPEEFFKKFEDQYNEFWTEERKDLEKKSGLTRNQIYALASIVYKESGGKPDEMKTIAGLYLNRYKKGMKLQSDPTVIYAVNIATNFKTPIKRVLYKHLSSPSPYNTYANVGIPPGPICIVDKNAVDAVLNAESNPYIFMCADPDKFGYHRFTASAVEHEKNAKDYQKWLNEKNIKK